MNKSLEFVLMRTCVTILCVLASLAAMGLTDEISVGKLTYSGITIVGVKGGMVTFKIPSGHSQSKAFSEITGISISGMENFNKADAAMKANQITQKAAAAAKKEEAAATGAGQGGAGNTDAQPKAKAQPKG